MLGCPAHDGDRRIDSVQPRRSLLLGGLLWESSISTIDRLVDDLRVIEARGARNDIERVVASCRILSQLPERSWARVTPVLARRLLVALVDLTGGLSSEWRPPNCLAQSFLLRCLLDQMEVLASTFEVSLDEIGAGWYQVLEENLSGGKSQVSKLRRLSAWPSDSEDAEVPRRFFEGWFVPFDPAQRLPPYLESRPTRGAL